MILKSFLLLGFLPLLLFFLLERFFLLYYMQKSEKRKNIIRGCPFLQPNFIGYLRYPMGFVSVAILYFSQYSDFFLISEKTAFYFWTIWMITDLSDGTIARHYKLVSEQGANIDPLSDKLMQFPLILYLSYLDYLSIWLALAYIAIDICGQLVRNLKVKQHANIFGKAKTTMVVCLITLIYSQYIFWGELFVNPSNLLMGISIFLALSSVLFRIMPNNYYGNLLSLTNFICGILGIALVLWDKENVVYTFLLVFLGQFFDLYDGRVVRKWGGTPRGVLYDDIADAMTFGATISFIIFVEVKFLPLALVLMLSHFGFSVFRLYRFTKSKNSQNKKSDGSIFEGLPTPASASLVGASFLLLKYQSIFSDNITTFLQIFVCLLANFLMVSKVPYVHFAHKILPKVSNSYKALSAVLLLLLLLWSFENNNYIYFIGFLWVSTVLYIIFGIQKNSK